MAQVKFQLHKRGETKTNLPIVLRYTFGKGQRFEYYTGLRGNASWFIEKYYTKASGKPIKNSAPNAVYLNSKLEEIKSNILTIERNATANNIPLTVDLFRHELDKLQKPEKVVEAVEEAKPVTFMQVFDMYIERCKTGINEKTGHKLSEALVIKYTTIKNMMVDFNRYRGKEIDFADFNKKGYNELTRYMLDKKQYSVNTYGRAIRFVKTILQYGINEGYHTNLLFQGAFKSMSEEVDSIYLNEAELQSMYEIDLSGNKRLDTVRDLFLIGCWTGLRFSDYTTIQKTDVQGERLKIKTQKTQKTVTIPIHPTVRAILEKYNYELPPAISNQKFNEYIREVAQHIEALKTPFTKNITQGGKTNTKTMEKWEAVSSHVARRSFATNAFKRKIEPMLIMAITGHTTQREFLKYVKATAEEQAEMFESAAQW
jgi:integrase